MKKSIILILLGIINLCVFSQTKNDISFETANTLYSEEKYEEAIKNYLQILNNGFESSELYYNIGNGYFKTKNYPRAILYYEKALLHNPENDNIQHNLAKAKMYNVDKVDEIPEFIISRWINNLTCILTSNGWSLFSIIVFSLTIICLLIYLFSSVIKYKKTSFYIAVIAFLLSILSLNFSYRLKYNILNSSGAIIMQPTTTVKGSPSETGTELFIIHEGTKVFIVSSLGEWYEIKLSDGKQGWLKKTVIEKI